MAGLGQLRASPKDRGIKKEMFLGGTARREPDPMTSSPILRTFLFLSILLVLGCSRPFPPVTEQTYYYWKPRLDLSQNDGQFFQSQKIQRLYIRFFDLDWDAKTKKPFARAVLYTKDATGLPPQVVPVVFVTAETLKHLKKYEAAAAFVLGRVRDLAKGLGRPDIPEIQMDGDWTPSTREAYFSLLQAMKKRMGKEGPGLSATIRLHQVKYRRETGVPPVDRGILMVYHTSAPQELNTKNSILDRTDARSYLRDLKHYPLPLDVAFPLFSWGAQFNQVGRFLKVFHLKPGDPAIRGSFDHIDGPLYRAKADIYLSGIRFMKDDYLKVETSDPDIAEDLKDLVRREHPNDPQRVLWFEYSYKKEGL